MTIRKMTFASAILAVLLSGCGGGGGGGGKTGGTIPITPPIESVNRPPVISSLSPQGTSADPIRIKVGGTQHLTVAASDPDKDPLTYVWSVDKGQISGTGSGANFAAPSDAGTSKITVKVSDGKGHTVSASCYFTVYKDGNVEPPPPAKNDPPEIASLVANPDSVDVNGTATITAEVTDPDGDNLTYSWSADGGGIQSETGSNAVWKAPSVAGGCTVTLAVSDGVNPAVTKSVSISVAGVVEPPVTTGLNATYIQNTGLEKHPDLSKGDVVLTRVDPSINFDWGRKAPDPTMITNPDTGNGCDFGVSWTGYIKCESAGTYKFKAVFDDGFALRISDDNEVMQTIMDGWDNGSSEDLEGTINVQGGKWYKFEASYYENEDRAYVMLYWMPPNATDWELVPSDAFRSN